MSKPKQDMEEEREDLTAEVRKTQEQKEARGIESHQPTAAHALYGVEQCLSSSMRSLKHQGQRIRAVLLAINNTVTSLSK